MVRIVPSWLRHQVGRRGGTLLLLAFLDVAIGYGLYTANPDLYQGQRAIMPLRYWSLVWFTSAIVVGTSAFLRNRDSVAFFFGVGVKAAWSTSFLVGWILGQDRAWVSAATWGTIAMWLGLIVAGWRENEPE